MVRDKHAESELLRQCNLRHSRNSVVHGDYSADAVRGCSPYHLLRDAVAVRYTVGNAVVDLRSQKSQRRNHQIRGRHTVHVVVTDDAKPAALI